MKRKKSEATANEKLLQLLTILFGATRPLSTAELAKEVNCSKQTILRLIDQLEKFGCGKLQCDNESSTTHYFKMDKDNIKFPIDVEGVKYLARCRNFMANILPDDIKNRIDTSLRTAMSYTGSGNINLMSDFAGENYGRIDYSKSGEIFNYVVTAIEDDTVCSITYKAAAKKHEKTYLYAPITVKLHNDVFYIHGWILTENGMPLHDKPTLLLLHKIQKISPSTVTYQKLPTINNSSFGIMKNEMVDVKLMFTNDLYDYIVDRRWGDNQQVSETADRFILTFTSYSYQELLSWVLSFGSKAQVIEPKRLKDDVLQELRFLIKKYDN